MSFDRQISIPICSDQRTAIFSESPSVTLAHFAPCLHVLSTGESAHNTESGVGSFFQSANCFYDSFLAFGDFSALDLYGVLSVGLEVSKKGASFLLVTQRDYDSLLRDVIQMESKLALSYSVVAADSVSLCFYSEAQSFTVKQSAIAVLAGVFNG